MIEVEPAALAAAAGIVRGVAADVGPAPAARQTGSPRLDEALRSVARSGTERAAAVAAGLQEHADDLAAAAARYASTDAAAVTPW